MFYKIMLIFFGLQFFDTFSWANTSRHDNGWVSAGGETNKDQNNPWFLSNTKQVYYCVLIGESFQDVPYDIHQKVSYAIHFWKTEFAAVNPYADKQVQIATQEFIYQEQCDSQTDIKLQFGILSDEQRTFLIEPQKYIGVSVRTKYSVSDLKGQGFIYISPDQGPDKFTRTPNMIESPWHSQSGNSLTLVLIHELGHVFGLTHQGLSAQMSPPNLMAVDFPEAIIDKQFETQIEKNNFIISEKHGAAYLKFETPASRCEKSNQDVLLNVFKIQSFFLCLKFTVIPSEKIIKIHQYESLLDTWVSLNQKPKLIGTITFASEISGSIRTEQAVNIYITKEQKILKSSSLRDQSKYHTAGFISGPSFITYKKSGFYQSIDKKVSFPVLGEFFPRGQFSLSTIIKDEFISID